MTNSPQDDANRKMDEKETLIRTTVILDLLIKKIDAIQVSMDRIENEFIVKATAEAAVLNSKVVRLESIIYGTMGVLAVEALGLIFLLFESNG